MSELSKSMNTKIVKVWSDLSIAVKNAFFTALVSDKDISAFTEVLKREGYTFNGYATVQFDNGLFATITNKSIEIGKEVSGLTE